MYATERQQEILGRARIAGRVDVKGLAESLSVTSETVRRDLTALERRGLVRRVHGGAIPVERLSVEPAVAEREGHMAQEKERIARAALAELPEGGSIILDAGTTTAQLAYLLPVELELTVVTHALPVAAALAARPNLTLHLLGGTVRPRTLAALGGWFERSVAEVFADVAFVGTNAVTAGRGLTTPDLGEAVAKRALVGAARRVVVLADHTKFGREDFAQFATLDQVDTVITDSGVSDELADEIENAGPRVVRA